MRDRRLLDLAKVIERQVQASITCTVTWRTYDESLRGQVPRHLDNPYFFLLWQMLQMIGTWSRDVAPAEKIELVLDQQNEAGRRVLAWYPRLLAVMDESDRQALPAAPVFRADRDLPPLKAADMWAWFWRREAIDRERHRRTRSSYERPAFGDVLCGIAPVNRNLEADDLKAIAQRLKAAKLPK